MSIQAIARYPIVVTFAKLDDDDVVPVWQVPADLDTAIIKSATVVSMNDVAAHTADYFDVQLMNGGTAGTATTALGNKAGGTTGWSALVAQDLAVNNVRVRKGELITLNYDVSGTPVWDLLQVQLNVVF